MTIMDLTQTWVYAPLPETQADSVQLGDSLRVVMPSGDTVYGKVIAKAAEGDFATQRDVSGMKRDIKTIQLKLLIPNPGEKFVPGMTAEVYIPKSQAGEAVSAAINHSPINGNGAARPSAIAVEHICQALRRF